MPRHVKLPEILAQRAFAVADAHAVGVTPSRLRGRDLSAPFHGVRIAAPVPAHGDAVHPEFSARGFGGHAPEPGVLEQCRSYAPRLLPGQFFSHVTAAHLWGTPLPHSFSAHQPLHISTWAPQRPPHTRGVIGHELQRTSARVVQRFGFAVADAASTWVQLAGLLPPAELVVVGDHFVRDPYQLNPSDPRPFTNIATLTECLGDYRSRGKRAAVQALSRVRVGAESRPETLLRLLLVDAGLPEPLLNQVLRDSSGAFLGRVDMLYPEWRVLVEYDGDQHRTSTRQYERDQTRLDALRRAGWTVIQVRKNGLFVRPDATVARVRTALLEAGWRP